MLTELRITNFAIIDNLELSLSPGLIVFTGETGAGKSIIFDAVESLIGGRVDANLVRSGAEQAVLEGTFRIPAAVRQPIHAILEREDLLDDEQYVTLGREIRLAGRSVARLNGRSVSVGLLKEIGEYLVDLHGQSEHLSLLRVKEHLGLLDRFANAGTALDEYQNLHRKVQAVRRELASLRRDQQELNRRIDLLTYQVQEIEAARLKPGEEEELRLEQTRLANAEGLAKLAQETLQALDEGSPDSPSASDLLGQIVHSLHGLARLDGARRDLHEQAESLFESLSDLGRELRSYLEEIEFNPKRLDQVEERMVLIQNLKRKYGEDIPAVLAHGATARQELEGISQAEQRSEELLEQERTLLQQLGEAGEKLSALRQGAAGQLSLGVQAELNDLRMQGAQFKVAFTRQEDSGGVPTRDGKRTAYDSAGIEQVEFLIAPNPGEGFKPLVKIASGGETSRLMLALKNVLASADTLPTLIFDEIDQGIGGRVGLVVGQKLWQLARQHQVLCITHLPQLAAYGDSHIHVEKLVQAGRTTTQAEKIQGERRLRELAQMFGEISAGTLHSAEEILQAARNISINKS